MHLIVFGFFWPVATEAPCRRRLSRGNIECPTYLRIASRRLVIVTADESATTWSRTARFLHRHATVSHRIWVAPTVYKGVFEDTRTSRNKKSPVRKRKLCVDNLYKGIHYTAIYEI